MTNPETSAGSIVFVRFTSFIRLSSHQRLQFYAMNCRTRLTHDLFAATTCFALHPEKTRIVHVRDGFEFLGYKIKRGKGLRMAAHKRTTKANPLDLYAIPRARSVDRFKDQIRNLTRRKA